MIHPTAIVAPGATLGANVRIGPYAIVGPEVTIGDDAEIASHVVLEGLVVLAEPPMVAPSSSSISEGSAMAVELIVTLRPIFIPIRR